MFDHIGPDKMSGLTSKNRNINERQLLGTHVYLLVYGKNNINIS